MKLPRVRRIKQGYYSDGRFTVRLYPGLGWRWIDTKTHLTGKWYQTKKAATEDLERHDAGRDATDEGLS